MQNAMKTKTIYDGAAATPSTPQAVVLSGNANVLAITGMTGNGTLRFEVSVDGGTTYIEDESLECNDNAIITLENANAIIRAKVEDVTDATAVKVILGY